MSTMNDHQDASDGADGKSGPRFKVECHGFECVNRGILFMLAIGVLLELVGGDGMFRGGLLDRMWVHDALAVTLVLAVAFQLRWWYAIRPSSATGIGGLCAQGVGVCAVSLLCLTGFAGALLGAFAHGGGRLFSEDLVVHHYLVYGVWAYIAAYSIFTLAQLLGGAPTDHGPRRA
ncbi:hypothetical protein [Acidihalobacter prosperus]|uniref:Uncharacterized protein n=1 Tax=Acidihalobacter prosperus TaxID=160660 RepID=A0A1A6C3T2_9GAMM|nr:hypothetical protein [Acidihalobacter prosperus]OBS09218.1 hypothetical protein Thpro_021546 [Acidihalobacter prosperus]